MTKYLITLSLLCATTSFALSAEEADTSNVFKQINLDEVVISTSYKETTQLREMPLSVSLIDGRTTDGLKITSLKEISSMAPNFYMPDYGSKLTSTMTIRGVGSRMSAPAVSLYVDDVPYIDKSSFDFELFDIESVEILRGPQGTLYGRNSLGGVIHLHTRSPFTYQGTKISVGGGNYGLARMTLSRYGKLGERLGYSLSGYYDANNGYFTNRYTGQRTDKLRSAGGRLKLSWLINDRWRSELTTAYDYVDQGGYPYGLYNDSARTVAPVNYNDTCSYRRAMSNNSLLFQYNDSRVLFTSTTAYQYLDDRMRLDQDFSPLSIFTMSQAQRMHTVNQEFTLKSNTNRPWQWLFGLTGFYQNNNTDGPVLFKEDGIKTILQPVFDRIASIPGAPKMKITNKEMPIPGTYKLPTLSGAIFHQSTFNNLLTEGLSLTLGVRLEHESIKLDHHTLTSMGLEIQRTGMPRPIAMNFADTIQGHESVSYTQLLPKIALKYDINKRHTVYGTVSKGYKSGGYNFQMFSDLIQESLQTKIMSMMPGSQPSEKKPIADRITYKPEYNWNYELGYRGELIEDLLFADAALFYIDIRDQQITQFAPSGFGRMARNAARSTSKGVEASLNARLISRLWANVSYGFTEATFDEYTNGKEANNPLFEDYKGNYVPLAPKHTLSIAANYTVPLPKNNVIDQLNLWAQYAGNGRIYWTEQNNRYQDFYGVTNAKVSLSKSVVRLDFWARNLFNAQYQAFYFESMGNPFVQMGRPTQLGVDLVVMF